MSTKDTTAKTTVESATDEPTITRHVEPESQALVTGELAAYFRCECGTEAMRRRDLRGEAHLEDCTARGGF